MIRLPTRRELIDKTSIRPEAWYSLLGRRGDYFVVNQLRLLRSLQRARAALKLVRERRGTALWLLDPSSNLRLPEGNVAFSGQWSEGLFTNKQCFIRHLGGAVRREDLSLVVVCRSQDCEMIVKELEQVRIPFVYLNNFKPRYSGGNYELFYNVTNSEIERVAYTILGD